MSQATEILRVLAKGKSLTPLSALRLCGTLSLSQRIGELKRKRWPIESEMVTRGKSRVACYFIPAAKAALVRKKLG
jgi:hypothetical protein